MNKTNKLILFFQVITIINLTNPSLAQEGDTSVCPNVVCPPPCEAIEGANCQCLPLGCENAYLSTDAKTNKPFCRKGKIKCKIGSPACKGRFFKGDKPICGSKFGYTGELAGPGCTTRRSTDERREIENILFNHGAAVCEIPPPITLVTTSSTPSPSSSSEPNLGIDSTIPFCSSGQISCSTGLSPKCKKGKPICGSVFGFTGDLAGPGCRLKHKGVKTSFNRGAATCALPQSSPSPGKNKKLTINCSKRKYIQSLTNKNLRHVRKCTIYP